MPSRLVVPAGMVIPEQIRDRAPRFIAARQRIWSQVATVEASDGKRIFLKRFVASGDVPHPEHFAGELAGWEQVRHLTSVRVPAIVASDQATLTIAYEHVELTTLDEIARADAHARFRSGIEQARDLLASLAALPTTGLARKDRSYGSAEPSVLCTGLEIRNLGLDADDRLVMFDYGPPYVAPAAEGRAKVLVSGALSNWGRPLRRHMTGPDPSVVATCLQVLCPTPTEDDRAAIEEEIALQRRVRCGPHPIPGAGRAMHLLAALLGGRYLTKASLALLGARPTTNDLRQANP